MCIRDSNETDQEDALSAAQDTLESRLIPKTDSEPLNEDRIPAEDAARNALPDIIPQTDIENENPGEVCSGSMHSNTPDQQIPQTDSDAAETPPEGSSPTRRIRKSRAKKSESGTELSLIHIFYNRGLVLCPAAASAAQEGGRLCSLYPRHSVSDPA